MTATFSSPIGPELAEFIRFKRALGYKYERAEFTLRNFDRFASAFAQMQRPFLLDKTILAWLARMPGRKPLTVSLEMGVLRRFCAHLRRRSPHAVAREPSWPQLPATSAFQPYIFSTGDIRQLLRLAGKLNRPRFRRDVFRAMILMLYCTGIRFGEVLRLTLRDVDTRYGILFISESKGRSRLVPFHRSLARVIDRYLVARLSFAAAGPNDHLLVNANGTPLSPNRASETIRKLIREAGLKPSVGRIGPRPYDLRHTFAVHRLTRWYRERVDLHARLPWLSAYMGHDDILGTEKYLNATPELLALAGNRFRQRYIAGGRQ
jgi:integrase/recombinase XerD